MRFRMMISLGVFLVCLVVTGCGQQAKPTAGDPSMSSAAAEFHKFDFQGTRPLDVRGYTKKVENFTILFDPSASMTEPYSASYDCVACHMDFQDPVTAKNHAVTHGGKAFKNRPDEEYAMSCGQCHQNRLYTKFEFAKSLARKINALIPNLDYKGTIRTYGYPAYHNLHYGLMEEDNSKVKTYIKSEYDRNLEKIWEADGVSPLAPALQAVGKDWFEKKGKIALIILSDGQDMDDREVFAAQDLKAKYGERICIYTILIGGDPYGRSIMQRIAEAGKCGVALAGDQLLDDRRMEKFVRNAFLKRDASCPDRDGDGIGDCYDDCPDTGMGHAVDENGCWELVLLADVLFDFDKYSLKPEGRTALDQVYRLLKKNGHLDLHISGHTDNYGSMAYNIKLSKRRARAGYNFLKRKGIDPRRMTISWHSFTMPVASNDTAEGRALNRRLEFRFKKNLHRMGN